MSDDRLDRAQSALGVTDLPPDRGGERWSKHFDCPFCGRKAAGINYALAWFHCFACNDGAGRNESWGTWSEYRAETGQFAVAYANTHLLFRFRLQIDTMAHWAANRFPWCVDEESAHSYAQWRIMVYAGIEKPDQVEYGPGDWNTLPTMEAKAAGDDNKLDSFVGQALKRDLLDYGKRKLTIAKREDLRPNDGDDPTGTMDEYPTSIPGPEDGLDWISYPTLALSMRDDLSLEEIADVTGKSVSTVQRMMAAELQQACEDRGLPGPQ